MGEDVAVGCVASGVGSGVPTVSGGLEATVTVGRGGRIGSVAVGSRVALG